MKKDIIDLINKGGIGVLPTDTVYGIHGLALNKRVVNRIYKIRKRNPKKPFIILISSIADLNHFKIKLEKKTQLFLKRIWPGKISVILHCQHSEFFYLHRGTNSLAFRMPKKKSLLALLKQTGPLISTSVNPEGQKPASSIAEAKKYFHNQLDFYMDQKYLKSPPSTLIKIENGVVTILRQGSAILQPKHYIDMTKKQPYNPRQRQTKTKKHSHKMQKESLSAELAKFQIVRNVLEQHEGKENLLHTMRHSASHVLAMAVQRLYPGTGLATGPAVENGFYYDFRFQKPLSSDDIARIQAEMETIKSEKLPFKRLEVPTQKALAFMEKIDQPYKAELVKIILQTGSTDVVDDGTTTPGRREIPDTVSLYQTGEEFVDLCRGPHVEDTSQIGSFRLVDSVSAAHWRTSKGQPELTRLYGLCFATQQELDDYMEKQKLAKERDHRKLGKELELFMISEEVGPGLTIWLPKGAIVRRLIENYIVDEQTKRGYEHVYSPHIGRKELWEKSGHWDLYRSKMYSPMQVESEEYLVKPMTCPIHCMVYDSRPRSYRELPVRLAEVAAVYRYEQSGELHGLMRVRAFTQDDAHIFARPDQVVKEFLDVFKFTQHLLKVFGFKDYKIRVGLRSDTEKYLGSDDLWKEAETKIREAVDQTGIPYVEQAGEAAFYGPKADFLLTDALGREWQCGTVQVDFMLPERFGLKYVDRDGQEKRPVMIHRAPLGSLERFMAIMVENNGGAFPTWLSPVQAKIVCVADRQKDYADKVATSLRDQGIRVESDSRSDPLSKKIREAEMQKVPYILVIGDKEVESETVSVRQRGAGRKQAPKEVNVEDFAHSLLEEIRSKS